jgi:hypothetical protein
MTDMVDVTKRLAPPATADEEALDGLMKRISPAFTALRRGGRGRERATRRGSRPHPAAEVAEVEAFWAKQARPDAVGWAQTARLQSDAIGKAVGRDWAAAKTSINTLDQQCQALMPRGCIARRLTTDCSESRHQVSEAC